MPGSAAHVPGSGMQERVRREKARRHFLDYCAYMDKKYPTGARHLQLLAEKLEQVAEYVLSGGQRGLGRLMVFMLLSQNGLKARSGTGGRFPPPWTALPSENNQQCRKGRKDRLSKTP